MKEFFGFGEGKYPYGGTPDGYLSWQHLLFVSTFVFTAIALAIFLGIINKNKTEKEKNKVLIWSAILIDGFEIAKIIIGSLDNPNYWRISLPLFLCSIQLITIPLAAFGKGRLKEASLDFVFIFGLLGGLLGTYGMALNYNTYPTVSWPNFVSAVTHSISGFAALYIVISGMASMKKENTFITLGILFTFAILAYVANIILDYNYMFLMRTDGTPYEIFYKMVNGNKVLYPIVVILLFVLYIYVFRAIFTYCRKKVTNKIKNQTN
jgi:uncharacterized membrane protein YwaF